MKTVLFSFIAAAGILHGSILSDRETDLVKAVMPNSKIDRVEKSEVSGWYRAFTGENLLYVNPFERKIFFGKLYTMEGQDLTSGLMSQYQSERQLDKFKDGNVTAELLAVDPVKYGSGSGEYVAAIFTDPFCPFCQRVDEYMKKAGATVYYHFYPLEQLHPGATDVCKRLYSAKNLKAALEKPLNNKIGEITAAGEKKLETSLALAEKVGVRGTPVVVVIDKKTNEIKTVTNANIELLKKYFGEAK